MHGVLRIKRENAVTLPHSAQKKHVFLGEIKEMSKANKLLSRNKIALEWLHQRLGHRYTRSLLAGDTANVEENFELRINPDPFCTSCQISSKNKKDGSNKPLKSKSPFKWIFIDIIPLTTPKRLRNEISFYNYLLIDDAYSKIPNLYGMEKISTEEVMNNLEAFPIQIWKNRRIWIVGFRKNNSRYRITVNLN